MRLTGLLRNEPNADGRRIREVLASNLCRCTGYEHILQAAVAAGGPEDRMLSNGDAFGSPTPQLQAHAKVTGAQQYASDVVLPGMLHGKILRSPHPHAKIRRINVAAAREIPGVVDVITFDDVPDRRYNSAFRNPNDAAALRADERVLNEKARYEGDRIAAVAAETLQAAIDAIHAIEVEWEPLPVCTDPLTALDQGAPEIHEGTGNEAADSKSLEIGDVEAGFAAADVTIEGTFRTGSVQHANLEAKTVLATSEPDGRVTIYATTQVPFHVRTVIKHALGIPESDVRVVAPDMGGGNGERSDPADEYVAVVLARRTGCPVRIHNTREEQFTSTRVRHPAVIESRIGARSDGALVARETSATIGAGGYATMSYRVMFSLGVRSAALYRVPNIRYRGRVAYTNTQVGGGMRGFGSPQASFAIETQLDQLAERLDIDPIELRIRNLAVPGDPYLDLPSEWQIRSGAAIEGLRLAAARCDWARKRVELRRPHADGLLRGIGVGVGSHISTVMPFYRDHGDVSAMLDENGIIILFTGVPDTGTGSSTIFAQIGATAVGVPVEQVRVRSGDTDISAYDQGAHSSRTTYVAGEAVRRAGLSLRRELLDEAANLLEAASEDLVLANGFISVRGTPSRAITLAELGHWVRYESDQPRRIFASGSALPRSVAPPQAVCIAEVAVDPRTGKVRAERMFEAIDCGRPVNPMFVHGQLHGSIHMGLGSALCEEMVYDGTGRLLTRSFGQYQLFRAPDMPRIETVILDSEEPTGPYGAKGLGEAAVVPIASAVANAVGHAIDIHPTELPLTPERVLALIDIASRIDKLGQQKSGSLRRSWPPPA
jgi:xanthine dehydrogenase molybdenum-binding subunit